MLSLLCGVRGTIAMTTEDPAMILHLLEAQMIEQQLRTIDHIRTLEQLRWSLTNNLKATAVPSPPRLAPPPASLVEQAYGLSLLTAAVSTENDHMTSPPSTSDRIGKTTMEEAQELVEEASLRGPLSYKERHRLERIVQHKQDDRLPYCTMVDVARMSRRDIQRLRKGLLVDDDRQLIHALMRLKH
jgi:hypothetical protein